MATVPFTVKADVSREEAIKLLAKHDGSFFLLKEGRPCAVPHDGFIMGWTRTHADGRKEDLTGVRFDEVGVDYLDYLLGHFGPFVKKERTKYCEYQYCHIWWRIWFYSKFERPDRWSMTLTRETVKKELIKLSPEELKRELILQATLGDVIHWRKKQEPQWDDGDYDPAFDSGEELRDSVRRSRYGDIYDIAKVEILEATRIETEEGIRIEHSPTLKNCPHLRNGASWLRVGDRKPETDDDPSPHVTVGLDPKKGSVKDFAQYAINEGLRGYGESMDDWTPSLPMRWVCIRNMEARGTKCYRFKGLKAKDVYGVKDGETIPFTSLKARDSRPCFALFQKGKSRLEMSGSEWRPVDGGKDFIRIDLYQWWMVQWNKLRSLAQVLKEERWMTIDKDPRETWKVIHKMLKEIERHLEEIQAEGTPEKELLPESFIAELGGMCEDIRDLARYILDPSLIKERDEIDDMNRLDIDRLIVMAAEEACKEYEAFRDVHEARRPRYRKHSGRTLARG
jgi:hypothetical protein